MNYLLFLIIAILIAKVFSNPVAERELRETDEYLKVEHGKLHTTR